MIMIQSTFSLLPGCKREALKLMTKMVRILQAKEGCQKYEYLLGLSDPDQIILLQEWEDEDSLERFFLSDHFTVFFSSIVPMLSKPICSRTYVSVETSDEFGFDILDRGGRSWDEQELDKASNDSSLPETIH